jgi:hypothetical protein
MDSYHLTLREAAVILQYKSIRSVYRFCRNNGVEIFADAGVRRKYLLKTEFDLARIRMTISYIKQAYGESWRDALVAHLKNDVMGLISIKQDTELKNSSQVKRGLQAEKFLTELDAALSGAK